MHNSILSTGLVAMLMLAMLSALDFVGAQETEDHDHADHAAETDAAGPSVDAAGLAVGQVAEGLSPPTAMAFLAEDTILVFGKDNCTVRIVEDCEDDDNDDHNRGQGRNDSDDDEDEEVDD